MAKQEQTEQNFWHDLTQNNKRCRILTNKDTIKLSYTDRNLKGECYNKEMWFFNAIEILWLVSCC